MKSEKKKRISWKRDIKAMILEALETNPRERFPNVRSVWYYLWSALHVIPGTENTYKKVDALTVDMRKEGVVPFGRFNVERGRSGYCETAIDPEWSIENKFKEILQLPDDFKLPKLFTQPFLIEVWVEKKGLIPTFENICNYEIKVRSPEGFSPWEFCYEVVGDFERYFKQRKTKYVKLLYFGDQDPSGENIYESLKEQLDFFGINHDTKRIGVTVAQIQQYGLPETPLDEETLTKIRRDSRYPKYIKKYGREIFCELDAFISLAYNEFKELVESEINRLIDTDTLREREELNQKIKQRIKEVIAPEKETLEEVKGRIIEHLLV